MSTDERFDAIVIGGGQAGLAVGYYLAMQGANFVILDENTRTGDSWRRRWDSLRLFTPAKYNSLPGMPFPGADFYFPTKDEAAGYLEAYAKRFELPVRHNQKVKSLSSDACGYRVVTNTGSLSARNGIVATGAYQKPYIPPFAKALDPEILQLHSSTYCNPQQVTARNVLVVGAGNSGAEISMELARAGKKVWLSGRDVGRIPADKIGRLFGGRLYWWFISRVLSLNTPIGRKMQTGMLRHGAPLIRADRKEVSSAGVESLPPITGVQSGKVQLADSSSLPVEAVIWATGFLPEYQWIDLPIFDSYGFPQHRRGAVPGRSGLFFIGLPFQTALSSSLLGGVGEDASYIAKQLLM